MRSTLPTALPVSLDRASATPLGAQLAASLRALIENGTLAAADALPSTRAWAAALGVSRTTVVTAYDQLIAEGYLTARRGSSTVVNADLARVHPPTASSGRPTRRPLTHAAQPGPDRASTIDFTPDRPSTDALITPDWRRAWRHAAEVVPTPLPPAGLLALRAGVSDHLRRMRGLQRPADDLVVTAGAREGLALLLRALGDPTQASVGVESPGYPSLRRVVTALGGALVELPVDDSGLLTDELPEPPLAMPDAVIVTPSHQYPLGGSLPVDRRLSLLHWARRHRVLVIEDDYDSELRHVGQPLPALAALDDPGDPVVATLGTYSKTVAPEVAVGFVIVPAPLLPRVLEVRRDLGSPVSHVVQQAFAEYLASGALGRHTARMRRRYRQRRDRVLTELESAPVRVAPMDGGLYAALNVANEPALLAACAQQHLRVTPLSSYWSTSTVSSPPIGQGIVIGYGHQSDPELDEGLRRLRRALDLSQGGD
ncbi:PLP-dependent aminotransferase family protein [Pseudoclavibacter soli]|uniref:MocR-like pyridoxine biosynthesis transcription factor PdxR n=1 Tax=Pseudoclavibacter soli TaxID=452623 RepID=UPI00042899AF|nr:PLP-dependent aminotransferase family protein [Pseudoclavibacter soli]